MRCLSGVRGAAGHDMVVGDVVQCPGPVGVGQPDEGLRSAGGLLGVVDLLVPEMGVGVADVQCGGVAVGGGDGDTAQLQAQAGVAGPGSAVVVAR